MKPHAPQLRSLAAWFASQAHAAADRGHEQRMVNNALAAMNIANAAYAAGWPDPEAAEAAR